MNKLQRTSIVLLLALWSSLTLNNTYALTAEEELSNLFSEIISGSWEHTDIWDTNKTVNEEVVIQETTIDEETTLVIIDEETTDNNTEEIELNSAWEEPVNWTVMIDEQTEVTEEVELNSAWEEVKATTTTNNVEIKVLPQTGPAEMLLLLTISFVIAGIIFYKRRKTI